ncbi:MAG: vitamin K epoxide reductase family protein [Anaerolineales bacterium]
MIDKFMQDPLANSLAVIVLIALIITWITSLILTLGDAPVPTSKGWYAWLMPICTLLGVPAVLGLLQTQGTTAAFAAVVFVVFILNMLIPILRITGKSSHPLVKDWYKWAIPITVVGGLVVAGYLTFIESTGTQASCGPLGHCAQVQQSSYAILFGILPIGVFGLVGYIAVLAAWLVWQFGPVAMKKLGAIVTWGMCIFGVLFSAYLTFLEPFVIGATCMWCISSAVSMIILLLASTPAAQQAFAIESDD